MEAAAVTAETHATAAKQEKEEHMVFEDVSGLWGNCCSMQSVCVGPNDKDVKAWKAPVAASLFDESAHIPGECNQLHC